MNRIPLATVAVLVAGTACIALARQQKTSSSERATSQAAAAPKTSKRAATFTFNINNEYKTRDTGPVIIKDTITGAEGARIYWATFDRIQPLIKQGRAAMAQKKYAQAEQAFRQALAIQPEDATSWLLLGETCDQEGKSMQAAEAYRQLVEAQNWGSNINSDPTTYMRYALTLCRSNDDAKAAQVFHKAMAKAGGRPLLDSSLDIDTTDRNQLQAAAHLILGTRQPSYGPASPDEQIAHLQAAARLMPRWGRVQSALADALQQRGRKQEAQTAQSRALARGDHNSLQERILRQQDENMRLHQLHYHPNQPELYQYHDPKMRPTQAEVDVATAALRTRNGAAGLNAANTPTP